MPKILIVEDSESLSEFLTYLLRSNNFETAHATTVSDMFVNITEWQPQVVLMDVKMDIGDGRMICKDLKTSIAKTIPVILMSADPVLLEGYENYFASDVIEKPFPINGVIEKINNQLGILH